MTGLFFLKMVIFILRKELFLNQEKEAAAIFWDQLSIIKLSIPLQQQSFSDFCHIVDGFQAD